MGFIAFVVHAASALMFLFLRLVFFLFVFLFLRFWVGLLLWWLKVLFGKWVSPAAQPFSTVRVTINIGLPDVPTS